jgi:hypothetical protein
MPNHCASYIGSVNWRFLFLLTGALPFLPAADLEPAAAEAFDRYVKLTEQALEQRTGLHDFLWLDQHPQEKELVWLGQSVIRPLKTLDQGQEIEVPGGSLQDWMGTIVLEHSTLDRIRDFALGYADYKTFFKQFFTDSKLIKRDGDRFDAFLRLSRKQLTGVVLNMNVTSNYVLIDPAHARIFCHSTHIGEVVHPKAKGEADQERPGPDSSGFLWRQNIYWRMLQSADGVYVELETITLSRPAGGIKSPSRYLNGFVEKYPREFIEGSIEATQQAFPHPQHRH